MSITAIGLIVSLVCLFSLSRLFAYERARGVRIGERARTRADFFVLKTGYEIKNMTRYIGREFMRQIVHYFFHTILNSILSFVRMSERGLKNVMRVNKTLAKKAERESVTRTKLDEIALHKIETALTEEEKKAHRDKMLNG
jgi:hypothetical protein